MPNPIKYSTGSETLALKKGNFYIGTGDVGKGPTNVTGYYNGITPPSGGYTIYLNKETGGPSIYTPSTDAQLISLTNSIAGASYTTVNECLVYFAGQTDKLCVNRDYEGIVTDGLVLNVDAGFTPSYPRSGTTWYDVVKTNNASLTNGPTFNSVDGGSVVTDGVDDVISGSVVMTTSFTFNFWFKPTRLSDFNPNFQISESWGNFVWHSTSNGSIYCGTDVGTRFTPSSSGCGAGAVSINTIQNFTYTFNSNTGSLYKNGQLLVTSNNHQTPVNASTPQSYFVLAAPVQFGKGNSYIFQMYNRALTASEVLQNYNAQKGRFGL